MAKHIWIMVLRGLRSYWKLCRWNAEWTEEEKIDFQIW
jgi:hypothetical protein